jgi:hypothetical protein
MSLAILFLFPSISVSTTAFLNVDIISNLSFENNSGRAEKVFVFPADHVLHQPQAIVKNMELFTEWLYWTGALKDIEPKLRPF